MSKRDKTWQDCYIRLKDGKNPLNLSSSEHRNLTKKLCREIFSAGQKAPKGAAGKATIKDAIAAVQLEAEKLKSGSERHKGVEKALEALRGLA
jgi:hypothetical protein